ncbi:MAG: helix-turn-helix transcriptional regulator [Eubacteriales bacterium]
MTKSEQKAMATRIKRQREKLLYTQEKFCEVIGLSASSYTKIENAFQNPSLETLILISTHLNISLDYLVFGDEERFTENPSEKEILQSLLSDCSSTELNKVGNVLKKLSEISDRG